MRIGTSETNSDYVVYINTNPRAGEDIQGFKVAYIDGKITVNDTKTSSAIFEHSINGVKGVQLSHENAVLEAYKKERKSAKSRQGYDESFKVYIYPHRIVLLMIYVSVVF
jgi:hypothetical protein